MSYICKICEKSFSSTRSLHAHIKKHGMYIQNYYCQYYPRKDKYSGSPIPYKDYNDYFETDFIRESNMYKWLEKTDKTKVKNWIVKKLKKRIKDKELKYIPSHVELDTIESVPNLIYLSKFFEEKELELELGIPYLFDKKFNHKKINDTSNLKFLVDTREQKPINFKNSESQKLVFGDYTLAGDDYNYTYVDRKSESDFKSTVTQGYDRFCREIELAISYDCYLYVVIESSIEKIIRNNEFAPHSANMKFVFSRMRKIQHKYPKKIQFVFSGSRTDSFKVIPYLLAYGKDLWNVDIQLILDKR